MRTSAAKSDYSEVEVLSVGIELSSAKWKLVSGVGVGGRVREKTIEAWDQAALEQELGRAKERLGLPREAVVYSCYEAGRDGFGVHRFLESLGVRNVVVDPSSIEVNRRFRRVKTDAVDGRTLQNRLARHLGGERKVWSVVRVPTVEEEASRQLHRELRALKTERNRHTNRIRSLLVTQGIRLRPDKRFEEVLSSLRTWSGDPLPAPLVERLERECVRLRLVEEQILELARQRRELLRDSGDPLVEKVRHLTRLRGIGENGSWLLVMEMLGWREFRNRRELGALSGLSPTPFRSGEMMIEQGISKAGIARVRAMMVELAWCWLRFQPQSELSQWFEQRYGRGNRRSRRVGIVALARKLLVALWRYLDQGVIPEGAVLKS